MGVDCSNCTSKDDESQFEAIVPMDGSQDQQNTLPARIATQDPTLKASITSMSQFQQVDAQGNRIFTNNVSYIPKTHPHKKFFLTTKFLSVLENDKNDTIKHKDDRETAVIHAQNSRKKSYKRFC